MFDDFNVENKEIIFKNDYRKGGASIRHAYGGAFFSICGMILLSSSRLGCVLSLLLWYPSLFPDFLSTSGAVYWWYPTGAGNRIITYLFRSLISDTLLMWFDLFIVCLQSSINNHIGWLPIGFGNLEYFPNHKIGCQVKVWIERSMFRWECGQRWAECAHVMILMDVVKIDIA